VDDGRSYAGMQNTDIGIVSLVNCPVYPVTNGTDGTESKMRFGPAPGPHFRHIGSGFSGPRWSGF